MSEDVKTVIQEFGNTFEEFKKVNDERIDNLEKGLSSSDQDAKLEKIEAKLDSLEDINQKITTANESAESMKSKVEELEAVITRPNSGLNNFLSLLYSAVRELYSFVLSV